MDWDRINSLLSVIHQAAAAGPKYQKWADFAAQELEAHWRDMVQEAAPTPLAPASQLAEPSGDGSTEFTGDTETTNGLRRF